MELLDKNANNKGGRKVEREKKLRGGKVMEDWEPRGGGGPALGKIRGLDLFRLGGADS